MRDCLFWFLAFLMVGGILALAWVGFLALWFLLGVVQ